jgi:hypothetical protein
VNYKLELITKPHCHTSTGYKPLLINGIYDLCYNEDMESAVYNTLHIKIEKRAALAFYHQLRSYIRIEDTKSFGALMELDASTLKDDTLMASVISIMQGKHPQALARFIYTLEE